MSPRGTERGKGWRSALRILRVLVTGGLLAAVCLKTDVSQLADALAHARPGSLLLGVGLAAAARYLGACQMQRVMGMVGVAFNIWQVIVINLSAAFYEIVLPAAQLSGGMVRLHRFSQPKRQGTQALAAILFNRFMDTLTLVVLGLVFWAFGHAGGSQGAVIGSTLAILLAALLAFHVEVKHGKLSSAAARWPLLQACRRAVPQGLRDAAERLLGHIVRSYRRFRLAHATMLPVAALSLARHLLFIASLGCFARAIGLEVPWPVFGWMRTVVVLLMMLPISVGGFGLREGSLVVLLAPFGVAASGAVSLSLVMFASAVFFGALGGLVELAHALEAGRKPRQVRTAVS